MDLKTVCLKILDQMADVINQLSDDDFVKPADVLSSSTLGQHFRHAIEFFECLEKGYQDGVISYDNREHDTNIERSRLLALEVIKQLQKFIKGCSLDKPLTLEICYSPDSFETNRIDSNMARELVYNIEHVVHHMALVKIGIEENNALVELPEAFGVAVSTIKYHRTQA